MSEITKHSKRLKKSFMLYIARRKDIKIITEIRTVTDKANFECLKCNYVWETYPYILKRRKSGCAKCAKRDEIERYKTRFKQFLQEEKLKLLSELKGYRENITVKCKVCTKEWESYPMRLKAASSRGCTDCNAEKRRIKKEKEFKKYLKTRDDLELIGNFKKNYVKAKFKCLICTHKWNAFPDDIKKSRGCPKCKLSRGEKIIENHLNVRNVKYITQWVNHKCIYKRKLRFDFYLPKWNVAIEFQGKQHYEYVPFFHRNRKNFEENQRKDKFKREYCEENNINLLEISYKDEKRISKIIDLYLKDKKEVA